MDELMHGPLQAKLLEHNVRFGDPECQCLMTRLQSDLLPLLLAASNPRGESPLRTKSGPPQLKVDQRQQRPWLRAGHPHLLQAPCAQSREVQTGSRTWTGQLGCSPGEGDLPLPAGSEVQGADLQWSPQTALTVVMAAKGYPGSYSKGSAIQGLDQVQGAKVGCS